jgi:hypothetical protein
MSGFSAIKPSVENVSEFDPAIIAVLLDDSCGGFRYFVISSAGSHGGDELLMHGADLSGRFLHGLNLRSVGRAG